MIYLTDDWSRSCPLTLLFPVFYSLSYEGGHPSHQADCGVGPRLSRWPGLRLARPQALLDRLGDQSHRGGQPGRQLPQGALLAGPWPTPCHRTQPSRAVRTLLSCVFFFFLPPLLLSLQVVPVFTSQRIYIHIPGRWHISDSLMCPWVSWFFLVSLAGTGVDNEEPSNLVIQVMFWLYVNSCLCFGLRTRAVALFIN